MDCPTTKSMVRYCYDLFRGDPLDKSTVDGFIKGHLRTVPLDAIRFHRMNYEVERAVEAMQAAAAASANAVAATQRAKAAAQRARAGANDAGQFGNTNK